VGDADDDRQANRFRALAESGSLFAEAVSDPARLLQVVTRRFADLVGDGVNMRLLADDGMTLEPVALYHPDPDTQRYLRDTTDAITMRVGEGISGQVVATGTPAFVPDVSFEQDRAQTKPELVPIFERVGMTSLIVVPLCARGNSLGFLALTRNGVGRPAYTEADLRLVQDLAACAALAIDNGRLVADLERRVAERAEALATANRELEAFTYAVSHDLRAPLRAIDGFAKILEVDFGTALDDEGRRTIGVIRRNALRMGRLIDDLLRFSRLGQRAIEPVTEIRMRPLVEEVLAELRAAEPARALDVRIGELPPAIGNHELLRQVWSNLLGNAVKYSRDREVAVIKVAGAVGGNEVRFTVDDNGTGFDPRYRDKLFGVFQRLHKDSEFDGTGVGLALVHRIVSRHGGRVWADGRPGAGATFGFALPRRRPRRDAV
jgi:signal transduction histidine kinase